MILDSETPPFATAMVVDDDPILLEIGYAALQSLGIGSIIRATSGIDALKKLEASGERVDLILSDLQMPGMDGMAFFRALKAADYGGALIVLSSMDTATLALAQRLAASQDIDVRGILQKPLDVKRLDTLLRSEPTIKLSGIGHEGPASEVLDADDLRRAIGDGEIVPFFQPKICVATGAVVGAEALARWRHPEKGLLAPDLFIGLAEQNGLIADLTWSILRASLVETRRFREQNPDFCVAVNLSADLLGDLGLPDRIMELVSESGLTADALQLEITESRLIDQSSEAMEVIGRLRLFGFQLSIDDFGTGQSNLATLSAYPFTELKIDQSFINPAPTDARARAIVVSCVELGRSLDMRIVAEGIETASHMALVAELGIDEGQGYWIARPQPAAQLDVIASTGLA
ncbi:MAG: EAL domain-containing response regulator [Hyphomicrobiaceae bacterium]